MDHDEPKEEGRDEGVLAELQAARDSTSNVQMLAELRALEAHRKVYQDLHPAARINKEDPDVDRIIEALAFFSLRTRQAVNKNLRSLFERLFKNYFDFLLAPLASMGMIQGRATQQRAEPAILPRGSEFVVTAQDGATGVFRTLQEVRILPVRLRRVRQPLIRPHGGYRLILEFQAPSARLLQLGVLRLHVNYLDDYVMSAKILYQIQRHFQNAHIVYDRPVDAETHGERVTVSYGVLRDVADNLDNVHPIEQIRRFFHFPEQELYLNIAIPQSTKPWTRFAICLDLDSNWSRTPHLNQDVFQLFAVPAVNLRRELAQPILCDGTQDSYPIRHPSPGREFSLQKVKGVFQLTPQGLEALPAGNLPSPGSSGDAWEVEESMDERGRLRHDLIVRMPDAFAVPRKLAVDAFWYQPQFSRHAIGALLVKLQNRHLEGVEWNMLGGLRPEQESPLRDDFAGLLQMLALKMKPTLGKQEIISIFSYMGTLREGPYKLFPGKLLRVDFEIQPDPQRRAGMKHVYSIDVDSDLAEDEPLLVHFLSQTMRMLDAWNQDADVELRLTIAGQPPPPKLPIDFK